MCNLSGDMTYYQTQKVNRIVNKQKRLTIFVKRNLATITKINEAVKTRSGNLHMISLLN